MTDQELRALVREAVQRHLGGQPPAPPGPPAIAERPSGVHPSHALYITLVNTTEACVIESDVKCTHCHYCKSHGH